MATAPRIAALFALFALASAQIVMDKTSLTLEEGLRSTIKFTLNEPIICPSSDRECAVVVMLHNHGANEVALSTCVVKWLATEWQQPRFVTITAVDDYTDDVEKTVIVETDAVISRSEYYTGYNLPDITLKSRSRPSRQCSGTGDPHYTTFDGKYWHQYQAGQVVFYKSTRPGRTFEIQAKMKLYPARNCALAGREGGDLVIIDACNGFRGPVSRFTSPPGQTPVITVSGSTYTVWFKSGAWMRAQIHGTVMNVYVQAPGIDYGYTEGMCGNNNGNPNDDTNGYRIEAISALKPGQKITYDLFNWHPDPNTNYATPTKAPHSDLCSYEEPTFIRPILNQPDAEDITDLVKQISEEAEKQGLDFNNNGDVVIPELDPISQEEAEALCRQAIDNSQAIKSCVDVLFGVGFSSQTYVDDCVLDLVETGDTLFIADAIAAAEAACAELATRDQTTWEKDENGDPIAPNDEIVDNLCPEDCNGHGQCVKSKCVCDESFTGPACEINMADPPALEAIDFPFCDTAGRFGCVKEIVVSGTNFFHASVGSIKCRFDDVVVTGLYRGALEVLCPVPPSSHTGGSELTFAVRVSNDGTTWSNPLTFTYFDSICQVCDSTNGCKPNPDSCTIDGVCHLDTVARDGNACEVCNSDLSSSAWSFDYSHGQVCGPRFEFPAYVAEIVVEAKAGDVLAEVSAVNELVAEDPNLVLTYTIDTTEAHVFGLVAHPEKPNVVNLVVVEDVVVAQVDFYNFENFFGIKATDQAGNEVTVSVVVDLVQTNQDPFFAQDSYTASVPENSPTGTTVATITAQDPDGDNSNGQGWGQITYSWLFATQSTNPFAIDSATGAITVVGALDYEMQNQYFLEIEAKDGGGQAHVTGITITVGDVNEAPTDLILEPAMLDENAPEDAVVGVLSAQDPDQGQTFTFAIVDTSMPFAIANGNELVATKSFDFETDPTSYDVTISVTDSGSPAETLETTVTVTINNINEPPYDIRVGDATSTITISEDHVVDTAILPVTAKDNDEGQQVFCGLANSAGGTFVIAAGQLVLAKKLDFETAPSLTIEIQCIDDGEPPLESDGQVFTVTVTNANDAPENVVLSDTQPIPENAPAGTVVGTISATDFDSDATSITFESRSANFAVENPSCPTQTAGPITCTATIVLADGAALDFEAHPEGDLVIRTTDNLGKFSDNSITITVVDVNEPPSEPQWAGDDNEVLEESPKDTLVGTLVFIDADAGQSDSLTATLDNSDNGNFALEVFVEGGLTKGHVTVTEAGASALVFVQGQSNVRTITVTVTDNASPALSATFQLPIVIVNRPVELVFEGPDCDGAMTSPSVPENVEGPIACIQLAYLDSHLDAAVSLKSSSSADVVFNAPHLEATSALDAEATGGATTVTVTMEATFTCKSTAGPDCEAPDAVTKTFEVAVASEAEPPVFGQTSYTATMMEDESVDVVVATVTATDPEGSAITYTIADPHGILRITSNGQVRILRTPTDVLSVGLAGVQYTAVVTAADADGASAQVNVAVSIKDDCAGVSCGPNAICVDGFQESICCDSTMADEPKCANDVTYQNRFAPSTNSEASSNLPVIIGAAVGALVLIALIALLIVYRRSKPSNADPELGGLWSGTMQATNPNFINPDGMYSDVDAGFQAGVSNPIYSWYQPDMSRAECDDYLADQGEGAFIIRDSKATPGWHILGVKTRNKVVHEKIRLADAGVYDLLPSDNSLYASRQPTFHALPDLVEHYASGRASAPFTLALDNPLYDNHQLRQAREGRAVRGEAHFAQHDPNAPLLPLKSKETEAVAAVADGSDIYTNANEAREVMSYA